jgi:hypothetical protein
MESGTATLHKIVNTKRLTKALKRKGSKSLQDWNCSIHQHWDVHSFGRASAGISPRIDSDDVTPMVTVIESVQGASHQKVVAAKINPRHLVHGTDVTVRNLNGTAKIDLAVACATFLPSGSIRVGSVDGIDEGLARV